MTLIKRNKTLFLAFVLYAGIGILLPHRIGEVMDNSLYYFKELFEVDSFNTTFNCNDRCLGSARVNWR